MDPKVGVVVLLLAAVVTAVSARSSSSPASETPAVTKTTAPTGRLVVQEPLDDDEVEAVVAVDSAKTVKQQQVDDEYSFQYAVRDARTGDAKQQEERRRPGGVVLGSYSLLDADGSQRTVQYSAHPVHGFTAVVRRDAGVGAALFVKGPFPTASPAPGVVPTVVLVRPQQQLLYGQPAPPQQLVYQDVPPPAPQLPQLLQVVTPAPARLQVHQQELPQVQASTPLPLSSARLVAVDVQRPLQPSADEAVVNIGGRERASSASSVPGGRLQGPHLLLSAQSLPLLALAPLPPAPLPGPTASPASSFFFFGQQHQQPALASPAAPAAHRAYFSLPLLQYGPAPSGPAAAPAAASTGQPPSPAAYRFPHPDPPVHFATTGQGYTSAVFTAFSNPYVSYAY